MKKPAMLLSALVVLALAAWVLPVVGQEAQGESRPVGVEQAEQLTTTALNAIREGDYKDAIHALHSAAFILEEGLGMHAPAAGMAPMTPGPPYALSPFMEGPRFMGPQTHRPPEFMDPFKGEVDKLQRLLNWLVEEHGVDVGRLMEGTEDAVNHYREGQTEQAEQSLRRIRQAVEDLMRERGIEPPEMPRKEFPSAFERISNWARELGEAGKDLGDIPERLSDAERAFDEQRVDEAWEILRSVHRDLQRMEQESQSE
jgi:hypothetical protein